MTYFIILFALITGSCFAEESEGLRLMRYGCENDANATGCFNYANLLMRRNQKEKALKVFKRGCELGSKRSCSREVVKFIPKKIPSRKLAGTSSNESSDENLKEITKSFAQNDEFSEFAREQQKQDRELMAIFEKYCGQGIEDACEAKECIREDNISVCQRKKQMASQRIDQGFEQYQEFTRSFKGENRKRLERENSLIKAEEEKCRANGKRVCSEALTLQGEKMKWIGRLMMDQETDKLSAKCDNGNVQSCYSLEFMNWQRKKFDQLDKIQKLFPPSL